MSALSLNCSEDPSDTGRELYLAWLHHFLRTAALRNEPLFKAGLRGDIGSFEQILVDNLGRFYEDILSPEPEMRADIAFVTSQIWQTSINLVTSAGFDIFILIPPPPTEALECYYLAVTRPHNDNLDLDRRSQRTRYYTLERSEAEEIQFFCEWTDEEHLNHLNIENTDVDAFLVLVETMATI